ncbi:MAG: hypothetical protein CVU61_14840 [Deltaproteobacteria bacterium HGW-Deltaproteobacteria-19]|jgi:hypothetical protein|nr:MAG: hypothetical protein CVU61_14840 [Deltaproteobacteria bacterium HGW-Deltaproteobacteria-19]
MKIRTIGLSGWVFAVAAFCFLFIQGCAQDTRPKFQTEYQAIMLAGGQAVFGKAEYVGKDYILLKDVFYIRSQVNQETKQVTNILIKKGQELHGAEQMYINTRHIAVIEPVSPESQVAKLIKEKKAQSPEGQKP